MNKKHRLIKYLPALIGGILVIVIAVGLYLVRDLFEKPISSKKQVQQVSVVQPPPPPPPPPEVKPPPPPEVKEEKIEEPEPEPEPEQQAEEPPPGDQLGVDAAGGAGSDGFGLVGKKGGRGLIGGNGTGNAIIYFGQQVGKEITNELMRSLNEKARGTKYSAVVHLWFGANGGINRLELANSSGVSEVDDALKSVLTRFRTSQAVPPNMPQPLKVRIRS